MDPARCRPALSRLASPLNSSPLCCTAASIAFQQWYRTDVRLGGSSGAGPTPKHHPFPLYLPTPSSIFKTFQQMGLDNQSHNLYYSFTVAIPMVRILFPDV